MNFLGKRGCPGSGPMSDKLGTVIRERPTYGSRHPSLWYRLDSDPHCVWGPFSAIYFREYVMGSEPQVVTSDTTTPPPDAKKEAVNHPDHYGGKDNPYEVIKVIEAWDLGFHLGNVVKYVYRGGKKEDELQDLEKAEWYLKRKIQKIKESLNGS